MIIKLSPSMMHPISTVCSRCFWLKIKKRFNWPVNLAMQSKLAALEEKTLAQEDFGKHFPEQDSRKTGEFLWSVQNVMSKPLPIKAPCQVFIGGEFDLVARDVRPENDGGLWIIDCKTTKSLHTWEGETHILRHPHRH